MKEENLRWPEPDKFAWTLSWATGYDGEINRTTQKIPKSETLIAAPSLENPKLTSPSVAFRRKTSLCQGNRSGRQTSIGIGTPAVAMIARSHIF
jgi:hypothetical protein